VLIGHSAKAAFKAAFKDARSAAERLTTANLRRGMTMATKKSTTGVAPPRNRAASRAGSAPTPPATAPEDPVSTPVIGALENALENIVEEERSRLMKAHAILNCVVIAMEDEGICAGDGPYYPAVIESARDLVNESINRLDAVGLALMSTRLTDTEVAEGPEEAVPRGKYEVREEPAKYVC
jgi:hypothetical protein